MRGLQHAHEYRQRHEAAQRIGLSHKVQPARLLADGVVHVCDRFYHAVCMVKKDTGALQRAVCVFRAEGTRQREHDTNGAGQRHRIGTAADIAALRIFFMCIRHLEIVHAVRGDGEENARCADSRGKDAGLFRPCQTENKDAEQKMAHHIDNLAKGVP